MKESAGNQNRTDQEITLSTAITMATIILKHSQTGQFSQFDSDTRTQSEQSISFCPRKELKQS
jgi:hypothetical protein